MRYKLTSCWERSWGWFCILHTAALQHFLKIGNLIKVYFITFPSNALIGVDIVRGRGTSEAVNSRVLDGKIKLTTAKRPTRKARELRARPTSELLRSLWPPSRAGFCYEVEGYSRS